MHPLPSPSQLDTTIRRGSWGIILGLLAFAAIATLRTGPAFTAMSATALGASCVGFAEWRTQPRLWVLGIIFLACLGPTYLVLAYVQFFHSRSNGAGTWLDFACGTMCLG